MQAIKEGVALKNLTWQQVYDAAKHDIKQTKELTQLMQEHGYIKQIEEHVIREVMREVFESIM